MPADLLGSRVAFVHSRASGYAPVVAHATSSSGPGQAISGCSESGAGKKHVALVLLKCGSNRAESLFFFLMKIVIAAGQSRVLNPAILQVIFDGAAHSRGAGYEKHFLA